MYRIGIDIGGTNTDAVLVNKDNQIIRCAKSQTTSDILQGFAHALKNVYKQEPIAAVFIGTTHALNAILEEKNLLKIGLIRLAGQDSNLYPPCYNWPHSLKKTILSHEATLPGGNECDGRAITPLDKMLTQRTIEKFLNEGVQGFVVNGVFSPLYQEQELLVKKWIHEHYNHNVPITLAHEIGNLGFIERENAAILNTALKALMYERFSQLKNSCDALGICAPIYITQNNGTVMSLTQALEFPIKTISSGPKNSFCGAVKLAGLSDAIVVDVGGTSTDIGIIRNNFLRQSYRSAQIRGISLGFNMPDTLSIALGGGSCVISTNDEIKIGPKSVGNKLTSQAQSFGGRHLTLTDAAISLGCLSFDNINHRVIGPSIAHDILQQALSTISNLCSKMMTKKDELPIILVGGGASLFPHSLLNEKYTIPPYSGSANAYGAALSEVGATIQKVINLSEQNIELEQLESEVLAQAKCKGALSPRIIAKDIIPYYYSPIPLAKVIISAAGSLF